MRMENTMDADSRQWIKDNQVGCILMLILLVLSGLLFVGCLSLAV